MAIMLRNDMKQLDLSIIGYEFAYDTDDEWRTFYVTQGMNREEYQTMIRQIAEMNQKYPPRVSTC